MQHRAQRQEKARSESEQEASNKGQAWGQGSEMIPNGIAKVWFLVWLGKFETLLFGGLLSHKKN